MTMAPSQLGVFTKSDDHLEAPNLQYHVQPLSLDKFSDPLHSFPAITASVCNLRPDSHGHIRVASRTQGPSPRSGQFDRGDRPPDRRQRLEADTQDRRRPGDGKISANIYGPQVATDEDLSRAAGGIATTIFHPVGTCKMGSDDMAVVDDRLRLRGLGGLRVADASIMPTITSGNTNSPTIMIAEKAAAMMREDRAA